MKLERVASTVGKDLFRRRGRMAAMTVSSTIEMKVRGARPATRWPEPR